MNPTELLTQARAIATSLFDNSQSASRRRFSEVIPFEKAVIWGSCIPVVSQTFAATRVLYGVMLLSFGTAELINKVAVARLNGQSSLQEHLALLKGGVAPIFTRAFEHIALGISCSMSLWGNLSAIFYELVVKPTMPEAFSQEVSVDPEALNKLGARIKRHSLFIKIDQSFRELKQLAFSS
jgi:hypothetical protein